jgi:aminopeptidase N
MRIQYDNIATRPALSLPRGFSAPVKIVGARLDDLPTLATHDSDGVVRWEAYNTLIEQAVLAKLAQQPTPPELHAVTAALLCDPAIDPALLGLMLSYPNPQDVESVPAGTSVVALVTALDSVQTDIATHHADALAHLFARTRATGAYRFETAEVGRRALHHAVLALRTYGANSNAAQDCVSLFEYADNMTDCFAALRCALRRDHGVHEALLAQYAARYGDDPLAMNKWFAVQAESPMVGTLSRLDALEHHRAFDIRNPNKIRALFGAFSTRNWARFHAADGTGYDYMAQKIVAIDTANPNVAARLVCAFERWKQFDATAQEQQKAALRVIVSQPGASRNVRELASKLLSA